MRRAHQALLDGFPMDATLCPPMAHSRQLFETPTAGKWLFSLSLQRGPDLARTIESGVGTAAVRAPGTADSYWRNGLGEGQAAPCRPRCQCGTAATVTLAFRFPSTVRSDRVRWTALARRGRGGQSRPDRFASREPVSLTSPGHRRRHGHRPQIRPLPEMHRGTARHGRRSLSSETRAWWCDVLGRDRRSIHRLRVRAIPRTDARAYPVGVS